MKIRKNDKIKVLSGRDRGREGVVERVYTKQETVLIQNVNIFKKHMRKSEQMPKGGVVQVPRPIAISKIAVICPKCSKPTRIGYLIKDGKKKRICKKCKGIL